MNIINLSPEAILTIAEAASRADAENRRLRLSFTPATNDNGNIANVCYKVGEGMWSAPFYDQEDPYRG